MDFTRRSKYALFEIKEECDRQSFQVAGLYRCRLDDVKIKGFHNATPELQFICRKNLLLSINIDKNSEKDLQLAVEAASRLLVDEKLEAVHFTSHVNVATDLGHYAVIWEHNGEASDGTLQECCNCLDKSFVDAGYVGSRKSNVTEELELRVVKRETFHKIYHFVELGGVASKFKTPRCDWSKQQQTATNTIL